MSSSRRWSCVVMGIFLAGASACASANEDEDIGDATSNVEGTKFAPEHERANLQALRDAYVREYARSRNDDFVEATGACSDIDIGRPLGPEDRILRWHIGSNDDIREKMAKSIFPGQTARELRALVVEITDGSRVELRLFPEGRTNSSACNDVYTEQLMVCRFDRGEIPLARECRVTYERRRVAEEP
jgi:hypothetical protein